MQRRLVIKLDDSHTKKCMYPMRIDLVLQILLMSTQQESIHFCI